MIDGMADLACKAAMLADEMFWVLRLLICNLYNLTVDLMRLVRNSPPTMLVRYRLAIIKLPRS